MEGKRVTISIIRSGVFCLGDSFRCCGVVIVQLFHCSIAKEMSETIEQSSHGAMV